MGAGNGMLKNEFSFYNLTFEELAATVVDRVLDLANIDHSAYRWGE